MKFNELKLIRKILKIIYLVITNNFYCIQPYIFYLQVHRRLRVVVETPVGSRQKYSTF